MSSKYQPSVEDWLRNKSKISSLYVDLNWKLDAVMRHMEVTCNFFATPQQYKKRFKKWGLAKSIKKPQWFSIATKVTKRQQNGKDSLVAIDGRVIDPKRLRSAIARYKLADGGGGEVTPSNTVDGISIRTPRPNPASPSSFAVDLDNSSQGFQDPIYTCPKDFEAETGPTDGSGFQCVKSQNKAILDYELLDDAINHPWTSDLDLNTTPLQVFARSSSADQNLSVTVPSLDSIEIFPQSPSCYIDWRFHKVQTLPYFKFQQTLEDFGLLQSSSSPGPEIAIQGTSQSLISTSQPMPLSFFSHKGALTLTNTVSIHAGLFQMLFHNRKLEFQNAVQLYNAANLRHQGDVHQCLMSTLKGFLPERCEGDLSNKVDKLLDPNRAIWQLFEIIIYLISNNLVGDTGVQLVLTLLGTAKWRRQLLPFMKVKSESVQAIVDRVIDKAIHQDDVEVIREFHIQGFDFDDSRIAACCCVTKDMPLVTRLLRSRNSNLSFPHNDGCRILDRLVRVGTLDIVKLAIKSGANPKRSGCAPCTRAQLTLSEAIQSGNLGIVRLLLDHGSESLITEVPHTVYGRQLTALSLAISLDKVDIVALLRERNAETMPYNARYLRRNLDFSENHSWSSVPVIDYSGWKDCQDLSEDNFGWHSDETDLLLQEEPFKSLQIASQEGTGLKDVSKISPVTEDEQSLTSVNMQHELVVDPQIVEEKPSNPRARWTQAREVDTNTQRRKQETSLKQAIAESDVIKVFELLAEGADVNLEDVLRKPTPLHLAVKTLNVEIVKLLLDHHADVNACRCFEASGWSTPIQSITGVKLSCAEFANGGDEIVRLLLENGADINGPPPALRSRIAHTPFHGLVHKASFQTIKVALEAGAEFQHVLHPQCYSTALQIACRYREIDIVELLLLYGADVNEETARDQRFTALQAAINREVPSIELVETLIRHGANVNAEPQAIDGFTPLQAAVLRQVPCIELVQTLLKHGADVNARPCYNGGRTAIQAAASTGHIPIAQILLEAGADVNAPPAPDDGCTAIKAAVQNGRLDMVQLLLEYDAVGDIEKWTLLEPVIPRGDRSIARILRARQDELLALSFQEVLGIITRSIR